MMCARCGKETKEFYNNLCLNCFLERMKNLEVKVRFCKKCGRYFVSTRSFDNKGEAVEYYLKKFVSKRLSFDYKKIPVEKIDVLEKEFICEECKELYSRKIEAILQLRGEDSTLENIINLYSLSAKKVSGGYDISFSSKDDLKALAREIKKRYVFDEKISRKLVGMKDGKRKYKDTILLRIYGKRRGN